MSTRPARFVHCPELETYAYPPDCPFSTRRAGLARQTAAAMGLLSPPEAAETAPRAPASREEMERFHDPRYLDILQAAQGGHLDVSGLEVGLGTPDCPVFTGMYDYAALACGATLTAAELLISGEARVAFNPSGGYHHAHASRAAGFCYVNDVVLACMRLADSLGRVLFVDVDAHHCDGVQEAFYDRPEVMTISLHESGLTLFPGTGSVSEAGLNSGRGTSINLPLPVGTYDQIFLRAFAEIVPPLAQAFDPAVVVLEIGADGLSADPLAHLELTNNAYARVVEMLLELDKPLLATGGGGYHQENTARAWALCWSVMCGAEPHDDMAAGLGGVMLETTEWQGGLRDRPRAASPAGRSTVEPAVLEAVHVVKTSIFPLHALSPERIIS